MILAGLGDPTARWAGVLYVLPTIATALSVPWWGRLADRYGCRLMLVRAQLGLAVAFWLAGQADSTLVLAVALVLQGVLGGTFAATGAYLATGLTGRDLAAALTLAQVGARLALVGGPATAGLLAGHVPRSGSTGTPPCCRWSRPWSPCSCRSRTVTVSAPGRRARPGPW